MSFHKGFNTETGICNAPESWENLNSRRPSRGEDVRDIADENLYVGASLLFPLIYYVNSSAAVLPF